MEGVKECSLCTIQRSFMADTYLVTKFADTGGHSIVRRFSPAKTELKTTWRTIGMSQLIDYCEEDVEEFSPCTLLWSTTDKCCPLVVQRPSMVKTELQTARKIIGRRQLMDFYIEDVEECSHCSVLGSNTNQGGPHKVQISSLADVDLEKKCAWYRL